MTPTIILVPTDLGAGADEALDYACDLARPFGARIHLVAAVSVPTLGVPELGISMAGSVVDGVMADSGQSLEAIVERNQHRATFGKPILRSGDPVDIINETARELGADLIVMTTHGRTGVARWLLGSVAEQVVRTSPVPVLTLRAKDPDKTKEGTGSKGGDDGGTAV